MTMRWINDRDAAEAPAPSLSALAGLAVSKTSPWRMQIAAVLAVLTLLLLAAGIVFLGGGTRYAYAHITYVPIITAAIFFGLRGGLATGVLAGLVMGPLMPLDVQAWSFQGWENWLSRTGFFAIIGSFSGFASDKLRQQVEVIRRSAFYDRLTGLPNRSLCIEEVSRCLGSHQKSTVCVLSVGVGGMQSVIAALSHEYNERLHQAAAHRLRTRLPDSIQLFALDRGLFAAVIAAPPQKVNEISRELTKALGERFDIADVPLLATGHAGLAISTTPGDDAATLLRGSVSAFQDAEATKRPFSTYDRRLDLARLAALRLLPDLQQAIRTGAGLSLHYQPILDLKTGQCFGAEALVRWTHSELGPVPPGDFIAAVERTALIRPLTRLVLELALSQLSCWQGESLDLHLSVNLSVRDLEDREFPKVVAGLLENHGVAASSLTLEVTETALMTSEGAALRTLVALRKMGISIALDDFGVGQSSLSYLAKLPADVLKLDQGFAKDLSSNPRTAVVVRAAIEAAHALGQRVVAEGIEDLEVLDVLRQSGCDFGQGYFFARPLPEPEFRAWLVENMFRVAQRRHSLSTDRHTVRRKFLVATG